WESPEHRGPGVANGSFGFPCSQRTQRPAPRLQQRRQGLPELLTPATLHELRERLFQRLRVRQDVEHPALLERRADDVLVEPRLDVDAAVGDAVVVGGGRRKAFGAPFGRDTGRGRMDGDRGFVIHPENPSGVDRRAVAAYETPGRRRAIPAGYLAQREAGDPGSRMVSDRGAKQPGRGAAKP